MQSRIWQRCAWGLLPALILLAEWISPARNLAVRGELTMLVTGTAVLDASGRVERYQLDDAEHVPADVRALVDRAAHDWHADMPHRASSTQALAVRIVASTLAGRISNIGVRGIHVGTPEDALAAPAGPLQPPDTGRPKPDGTAYLALKVDSSGRPADVVVEQVNLDAVGSVEQMSAARATLAGTAAEAARHWSFKPARMDEHVPYRFLRAVVRFGRRNRPSDGWKTYLPGPHQTAAWRSANPENAGSSDDLPEDGVHLYLDESVAQEPPALHAA